MNQFLPILAIQMTFYCLFKQVFFRYYSSAIQLPLGAIQVPFKYHLGAIQVPYQCHFGLSPRKTNQAGNAGNAGKIKMETFTLKGSSHLLLYRFSYRFLRRFSYRFSFRFCAVCQQGQLTHFGATSFLPDMKSDMKSVVKSVIKSDIKSDMKSRWELPT